MNEINKYMRELNNKYNMNLKFIYNDENILIQNLKEYLSKSEYIKIESFNDEREEYIFYIRKDSDSEYLKYNIRFIYEEIKIFQSNNYKEYEIYRYEEYNNLEIFSINIYIFEYDLDSIFEMIIRFIEKNINYINDINDNDLIN